MLVWTVDVMLTLLTMTDRKKLGCTTFCRDSEGDGSSVKPLPRCLLQKAPVKADQSNPHTKPQHGEMMWQ